jgi:hypothetical protein
MCKARVGGRDGAVGSEPRALLHPEPVGQCHLGALYRGQHDQRHPCGRVRASPRRSRRPGPGGATSTGKEVKNNGTEERAVCPTGTREARIVARHHRGEFRQKLSGEGEITRLGKPMGLAGS